MEKEAIEKRRMHQEQDKELTVNNERDRYQREVERLEKRISDDANKYSAEQTSLLSRCEGLQSDLATCQAECKQYLVQTSEQKLLAQEVRGNLVMKEKEFAQVQSEIH